MCWWALIEEAVVAAAIIAMFVVDAVAITTLLQLLQMRLLKGVSNISCWTAQIAGAGCFFVLVLRPSEFLVLLLLLSPLLLLAVAEAEQKYITTITQMHTHT